MALAMAGMHAGHAMAAQADAGASAPAAVECAIPEDVWPEHRQGLCAMPVRVREFVARRDLCEHFLGEEPYDAERRAFLEHAIEQNCSHKDADFAELTRRYRKHASIVSWLQAYASSFEP